MSLFRCESCGCLENTALSNFHVRYGKEPLCSECDPDIGKWHGHFEKKTPDEAGLTRGEDGFYYEIKIYEMNGCDWWADFSEEKANRNYTQHCLDVLEYNIADVESSARELTDKELDTLIFYTEEEKPHGETVNFREALRRMIKKNQEFPCLFASTEH